MVRWSSCGNMAETCEILVGSTFRVRDEDDELEAAPVEGEEGLLRYQRIARKPTRATAKSCGMFIEVSCAMMRDVSTVVGGR